MNHNYPLLLAAVLSLVLSCSKSESGTPRLVEIKASGEAAKTALDGNSVVWSKGDRMMVFSEGTTAGKVFRLLSGQGTSSATFLGEEPASGAGHYFAAYPSTATYNGNTRFNYIMPAEVGYTEGSFAPESNPMLSSTKETFGSDFAMKNLCGVMKLRLKGSIEVSRLELSFSSAVSGQGHTYRGNFFLTMDGTSEADKKVTMVCSPAEQLSPDYFTDFYFVLPPADYDGFSINAYTSDEAVSSKPVESSFSISRSQLTTLEGTLPKPTLASRPELQIWSFNITCQKNDDNSSWSSSHYWDVRKDGVYAFFNAQTPDIIGTQECEYRQRLNILDNTNGYSAYGLGTDYGHESSGGSGSWLDKLTGNYKDYNTDSSNAIFYDGAKFTALDQGTFWLSSNPSSVGSDNGHNCAWIKFRWNENGYVFYFFNTHFTAHNSEANYAARKAEATVLYDQIASINTENLPMIVTGDFNESFTDLCNSEKGDARWGNYYSARNIDGKTSKTSYPTSYNGFDTTCSGFTSIYSSGTCTNPKYNIDLILYKNFYENSKHGLKAGSFGTDFNAYAGTTYISDHWPVTATLVFDFQ